MAWFELHGDERLGRCATEDCWGQPMYRLESYGVGSNYCSACCAEMEQPEPPPPPPPGDVVHDEGHPHLIDGEFQSDKYPTCPRGKVPLSLKDKTAQDLLWEYAQRRRSVDAEFSADLELALTNAGFKFSPGVPREATEAPWVIRKGGAFYRSNCAGYTNRIEAAGIYTREFAEREAQTEPQSMSAHPLSEFRPELQHNYEIARRQLALIDCRLAASPLPTQEVSEALGSPVDPVFTPTRDDLNALRKDYADMEGLEGLPVKVHVAPAVLYMTWPNSQYQPDDGSSPHRCISFHIPKPPESALRTGERKE